MLLNKRNSPTLEHALAAITECIKLDTGCVRKVFTQTGTPVTALNQFFEEEDVFFAYGNERFVFNAMYIFGFWEGSVNQNQKRNKRKMNAVET